MQSIKPLMALISLLIVTVNLNAQTFSFSIKKAYKDKSKILHEEKFKVSLPQARERKISRHLASIQECDKQTKHIIKVKALSE